MVQDLELGHSVPFPDLIFSLFCINEPAMEVASYIPWALK